VKLFILSALAAGAAAIVLVGSQAQAASPPTLRLATTPLGKVLVDSRGHSLYLFAHDKTTKSTCYGTCATDWPPFLASIRPHLGTGVKTSLLGLTKRKDGRMQVTYHGHPLYFFFLDKSAGQTKGQGLNFFGGEWYVLGANGLKVEQHSSTTSTNDNSSGSTSTTGGGGYYGP
jgi:predicted lipoprotein with Yx(FWY)xxD motif